MRCGKENLFDFMLLSDSSLNNFITFNLRSIVVNFNAMIAKDNFKSFEFTVSLGEEEEFHVI